MSKINTWLYFAIALVIMLAAVFTYAAPHLCWRVDPVLSGSMEPAIKVGSVVITCPVEPEDIKTDDVITFKLNDVDMMITHRVIGIGEGAFLYFITRGDANDKPDPFIVPASNVVGRVCFCLPLLGRFVRFLDSTAGYITCLILPAVVIIGLYVWRLLAASGNKETTP